MTTNWKKKYKCQHWLGDYVLLGLILTISYSFFLGDRPLFVPDEGRYAEIAREMVASHDYLTPRLNHILYFEKPVLFYWLVAVAIKLAGTSLWAVRSVNVLLALLGCLATYTFTRQIFNRKTGLLAGLIQTSCLLYFVMAHMVTLDLAVSVFITCSLLSCFISLNEWSKQEKLSILNNQETHKNPTIQAHTYFYIATIFASLAMLTKGLIGIVFPGMITLVWMILTHNLSCLKRIPWLKAITLFVLITLPWHLLLQLKHPSFLNFYFLNQQILRYAQKGIGHYKPATFFIPYLLLGLFPWMFLLPQTLSATIKWFRNKQSYSAELYLLLSSTLIFIFFSFSKSKLIPYILPAIPPLAILIARYIQNQLQQQKFFGIRCGFVALTITTLIAAYFIKQHATGLPANTPQLAAFWITTSLSIMIFMALSTSMLAIKKPSWAIYWLIPTSLAFAICFLQTFGALDTRTVAPLADKLKPILKKHDEIITYNKYYQDLPFYLERRVSVLNWRNELTFGMKHQDTRNWMINNKIFLSRFKSKHRVYVIIANHDLKKLKKTQPDLNIVVIGKTIKDSLITNLPLDKLSC